MTVKSFEDFLTESASLQLPHQVSKSINVLLRHKAGASVGRSIGFSAGRNNSLRADVPVKPGDGPHDLLVKGYNVQVDVDAIEDKQLGSIYRVRFDLKWDYKNGGSNGKYIGFAFIAPTGDVILWNDSSF